MKDNNYTKLQYRKIFVNKFYIEANFCLNIEMNRLCSNKKYKPLSKVSETILANRP